LPIQNFKIVGNHQGIIGEQLRAKGIQCARGNLSRSRGASFEGINALLVLQFFCHSSPFMILLIALLEQGFFYCFTKDDCLNQYIRSTAR